MTLQEQFNSIKNGKGNKDQFLKQARQTFPQYLTKFLDFDTSVNILKSKQLINEAIGGVVTKGFNITNWKQIFEAEVKAEEKSISKEAEDANRNMYDNKNVKNANNINFNEILKGYLAELGDPKNAGKTGDELKDIVVKNLAKDCLHYTKDGMFGVKGVGFTTEAPGLGEPKEAKGKYKASGYGDIEKEVKVKANVQDSLGDKEAKDSMPKKVKEMTTTPQNSAGVKKMKMPGAEKKMKLQEIQDPNKFELGQENIDDAPMGVNDKASSKPMKAKVDIKSTLEKIASEVFKEPNLDKAKSIFKNHIETSGINDVDKKKILINLESIKNIIKLYQYLSNSLLHYEGMGVSKLQEDDLFLDLKEISYQMGMNVGSGAGSGTAGGRRFIPTNTLLSKEAFEKINAEGNRRMNFEKPHIKIIRSGENIKLQISQHLLEAIAGAQRGRFTGSALQSKSGTGITSEDLKLISPEFRKLVKTLNEKGKLAKTGEYYLLDVDTKFNPKKNVFMLPLPNQLEENREYYSKFKDKLGEYSNMSDEDVMQWADDEGYEYMIEKDDNGILKNREDLLIQILDLHDYPKDEEDKEAEYDFGPDDMDPAGGYGPSSHMEESISVNGKSVKIATQNGDKSYSVTYDDGTKETIYVSNNAWDEINKTYNPKGLKASDFSVNESKIRSVIAKIIKEELKK